MCLVNWDNIGIIPHITVIRRCYDYRIYFSSWYVALLWFPFSDDLMIVVYEMN